MKILVDTNIALDVLLHRQPFYAASAKILDLSVVGVESYLSASAVTDIYYITRKETKSAAATMSLIRDLLSKVSIVAVNGDDIHRAVALEWDDFEDAVQYCAGERLSLDCLVSRDKGAFQSGALPVHSPDELLAELSGD